MDSSLVSRNLEENCGKVEYKETDQKPAKSTSAALDNPRTDMRIGNKGVVIPADYLYRT
jgi:hypothetical protein